MADFNKKIQSENRHLENLTSARFYYVDGSVTTQQTIINGACRLVRCVLNTNGATITLKDGTRTIAVIASDAPEGPFDYGLYIENKLTVQANGAVDATVVFD
jgi:hypothetical protein